MKKHLAPCLLGLGLVGALMLVSPANAQRSRCAGASSTAWTTLVGVGGAEVLVGTAGNDVYAPRNNGERGPLIILGLEGNDVICGSRGDDVISGGPGNDVIDGRAGNDSIDGGEGQDILEGGRDDDIIDGGDGHDILTGGRGADQLFGGPGIDVIYGDDQDTVDHGPTDPGTEPPAPTPTPTPEPTVMPSPEPTASPQPTAEPTATPTPSPQPTPTPTPGGGTMPGSYAENLAVIQGASATADVRRAIIWDTYQEIDIPLNEGNPNRYTPSRQLNWQDYVYHYGSQYGQDGGRGPTGGVFHTTCQFSHLAYDDPIVFPGQPGRSHLHMFFGNTHANAFSTADSILNEGGSTCSRGELNRTSYWIPAPIDTRTGNVVVPDQFMVYYESYDEEWNTLQPFPEGLRFINGDAMATQVQPDIPDFGAPVMRYQCGFYDRAGIFSGGPAGGFVNTIPDCDPSVYSHMEVQMRWPFCWDGRNLDSANHKDHVVFPQAGPGFFYPGTCPASHPITLPRILFRIHFATDTQASTGDLLLSSDIQPANGAWSPPGVSGHADWFGGWNREMVQGLVDRCILTGRECDPWHFGTPGGEQSTASLLEARTISPSQVVEYCPRRSAYDGNLFNIAYCRD